MNTPFANVQRIVLVGSHWEWACHLALRFGEEAGACRFLSCLQDVGCCPTAAGAYRPPVQISLGFSRRGLEHVHVPEHVLTCFALKSPAFSAGAALRASSHLACSGRNAPGHWDPAFGYNTLDAVLSLHATDRQSLVDACWHIGLLAKTTQVEIADMVSGKRLPKGPEGEAPNPNAQWVHFGYRDGLSRVAIKGWTEPDRLKPFKPTSVHEPGEFLLGHAQDSGANPWIAGPGSRVWPDELRSFFRDGSFGVLHQIEQDVPAFEAFVKRGASASGIKPRDFKAKLCGRYPDGRPLAEPQTAGPEDDFDYSQDAHGYGCPFGAHIRRMNPRSDALSHAARTRPLLRRGMPYGPAWRNGEAQGVERGLMAQFFCASIEDQFEHLVGQWADRVPMGSQDGGGARDPLIGAHELADGAFEIPKPNTRRPIRVDGLSPFTRTAGVAYLFYPSLSTLQGIARQDLWYATEEDDE